MQFIPFCLFALLCGYSLINAAPIKSVIPDTQEAKHQKAHEIANRLLKELAGEQTASNSIIQPVDNKEGEEHKETTTTAATVPVNRPVSEKVEAHVGKPVAEDSYDEDNQDLELTPTIEDLYEMYNNNYIQLSDNDDETSSELFDNEEDEEEDDDDDDDFLLPITRDDLLRYLDAQEEIDEHSTTVPNVPIMDDSIMPAEEHQHQRRRRSLY